MTNAQDGLEELSQQPTHPIAISRVGQWANIYGYPLWNWYNYWFHYRHNYHSGEIERRAVKMRTGHCHTQIAVSDKSRCYKYALDSLELITQYQHQFILRIFESYSLLAPHFLLSTVHFYHCHHGNPH
ncbi:hypothetical protein BDV41DRAFT_523937 [Aspergillus transmontanensis]|uniref:Uncharacterized protein n=1 Tax=Aspergillus transmontanensis TaxID=1034304 RepID=A0A5N6WEP3_9EURO|nr:hypothetical protein BDV41DRAFT_523937 [Aspergillus transmontanensis]